MQKSLTEEFSRECKQKAVCHESFKSLHFIYCSLVRMFRDCVLNNKISRIRERYQNRVW